MPRNENGEEQGGRGPALNQVTLLGRLAANPKEYVTSGERQQHVAEFRLVTNERPDAEYHDLVAYGRLAEVIGQYMKKGRLVLVQGRLHAQTWKAEDDSPRRRVVVIAENVQFLSRAQEQG
jgi:single-strand DNA-binding protein